MADIRKGPLVKPDEGVEMVMGKPPSGQKKNQQAHGRAEERY